MTETKKHAIRCETQEQKEECLGKNLVVVIEKYKHMYPKDGYTIITYEEAVGLGLLGEKEVEEIRCIRCGNEIPTNNPRLTNKDGDNICMGCEFKKSDDIVHWYKDGDTVEAEFDGCLYYGELKRGFVINPVEIKDEVKEESNKIEELKHYNKLLNKDIVKKINEIIRYLNK